MLLKVMGQELLKKVGKLAYATATSFFPAKHQLGCYGDGGAVFTDDNELAEVLKGQSVCTVKVIINMTIFVLD